MFGGDLLGWLTGGSDLGLGGGGLPPGMSPGGGGVPMPPAQGLDVLRSAPPMPGPQFTGTEMPPGMYPGGGQIPMPPVQQTGEDMAPPVPPTNIEAMPGQNGNGPTDMKVSEINRDPATEAMPGGQGGPAPAPPMPVPRPAAANGPLPPGTPPPPVGGGVDVPGVIASYAKAGGDPLMRPPGEVNGQKPEAQGMIARALGLSPEVENRAKRGLAAGLKAAGNSSGKSPFQALTSGAGATMEGENTSDDNEYNKKLKYLSAAVAAQSAGDKAAYNKNYLKYLNVKAETDKAAGGSTGKSGAWNKPDSQKFLDAQRAVSQDPDIKASQKVLENVLKTGSQADIAKAQADHAKLVADKQGQYVSAVGLDPAKLAANMKNPPGSPQNPHIITTKADFDRYVQPGQAYKNPADGKMYIRKGGDKKSGADSPAASPATPATPPLPPGPPPMPMSPTATLDDDE